MYFSRDRPPGCTGVFFEYDDSGAAALPLALHAPDWDLAPGMSLGAVEAYLQRHGIQFVRWDNKFVLTLATRPGAAAIGFEDGGRLTGIFRDIGSAARWGPPGSLRRP